MFLAIVMEIADPSTYRLPGSSLWNCIEATVNENMKKVVFQRDPNTSIRPPIIGGESMIRWIFLQVRSLASQSNRACAVCVPAFPAAGTSADARRTCPCSRTDKSSDVCSSIARWMLADLLMM